MTVSNAFSRPTQLSPELRQRILTVADELGYVGPDPVARALARGTTGAIGVLLTDSLRYAFADEVAAQFIGAIAAEFEPTGFALTLLTAAGSPGSIPARDLPMDGALVYSCQSDSTALSWLIRRQLPLVFVDQMPVAGVPSINVDDRHGARAAAQHLIDLGHHRVGIISSDHDGPTGLATDPTAVTRGYTTKQRMLGWVDALAPAGIEPVTYQHSSLTEEAGFEAAGTLLRLEERPTALLCFCDTMAFGAIRAAKSIGLRVPGDVSVVGFDDSPLSKQTDPPLTTVRQDFVAKGRAAATALLTAIERKQTGHSTRARHILLPTQLVVRDSTAPIERHRH